MHDQRSSGGKNAVCLARSIGALGVVYGDIGTSVLYAFKECLHHGLNSDRDIIGVLSLIIWSLFILVGIKYLAIIMRADNQGEGGILALLSLAFPGRQDFGKAGKIMIAVGIAGAALLYGDGVITPAISVLSAVEGLLIATQQVKPFIIPLTLGILVGLFALQYKGTGAIGKWFGVVMLVWFSILALLGVSHIIQNPAVLRALNPLEGIHFVSHHGAGALAIMGSVFLVVTGGEALYADMGHFGREHIARAWTFLVCPALILNYLGQGALVLGNAQARENPFFYMAPSWALYPLIGLATAATIIASQALISGAFSLTMQGIQMGYIPRMEIRHTSQEEHGQIYIPKLNILLALGCAALVIGFKSSSALASAYGIAVTLTMLATTVIFYFAAQRLWQWSPLKAGLICLVFGSIEFTFCAANSLKIFHGGWFPLVAGAGIFLVMTTWKKGRDLLQRSLPISMPLDDFIASISIAGTLDEQNKLHRSQGTAVFLAGNPDGTPNALLKNIKHNQILHACNIILSILTDPSRPHVQPQDRILATGKPGMAIWREHLFVVLSKHAENAADFFQLPPDRVYEVSQVVEI